MLNTNKTDHLGSTSYLTDTAGSVCQFVCYTPYGEAFVDEHSTTYENPFKFSGKELDDVTGLYDHGARSRNPITTIWLGVDPLWEKYPWNSPYVYCNANPLKYIDLDGRENTVYVVEQKSAKRNIDIQKIAKKANEYLAKLNLKTRLKVVNSKTFDPSKIDKTDSYVVVGDYKKVVEYLRSKMDKETFNENFGEWLGGQSNPEKTTTKHGQYTKEMGIDARGAEAYAKNHNLDKEEYISYLILHGMGHNSGFNHTAGCSPYVKSVKPFEEGTVYNAAMMVEGCFTNSWFQQGNSLGDIIEGKVFPNTNYINALKKRYGTNKSSPKF